MQNETINGRQQRLEENINRHRIAGYLKEAKTDAENSGMVAESKLITDVLDYMDQGDSAAYRRLRKNLKLRKLRII